MVNTRIGSKNTGAEAVTSKPTEPTQPSTSASTASHDVDSEVESLKQSLTPDSQTLVQILTIIITQQFSDQLDHLKSDLRRKDTEIANLQEDISCLKSTVEDLKQHIDNVEQYERRDTVLLSGPMLPKETNQENSTQVAINSIRDNLRINISERDINIAHRLGSNTQQKNRSIIVKLANRSLKQDLIKACVNLKPQFYVNESLTPTRLNILKQVLTIRKAHRAKFQQCYTSDGKIVIKLRNSTHKYIITDNKSLLAFLERYPEMKDTYLAAASQQP